MGFMEAVKSVIIHRFADFQGRSPRSEYWWFFLFYVLVILAMVAVFGMVASGATSEQDRNQIIGIGFIVFAIFALAMFIPNLAVQIRRFHDQDKSGWFILLGFVPYVGGLIILVFMCLKGTEGDNRFGPDPLGNVAERFS